MRNSNNFHNHLYWLHAYIRHLNMWKKTTKNFSVVRVDIHLDTVCYKVWFDQYWLSPSITLSEIIKGQEHWILMIHDLMICFLSSVTVSTQSLSGITITAPLSALRLYTPACYSKIKILYLDENRKRHKKTPPFWKPRVKPGKSLCSPQSILFHASSIVDVHVRDTFLYIGSDANRNCFFFHNYPKK